MKKKITLYTMISALLICLIVFVNKTNAQISYHDLAPDVTLTGSSASRDLDINNDATNDFKIGVVNVMGAIATVIAYNNCEVMADGTSPNYTALALNSNAAINSSQAWINNSNLDISLNFAGALGHWVGVTNKYLGIRVDVGGQKYYGWVRMDITANGATVTIKDYAYQQTAGQGIVAGDQGSSSIEENKPLNDVCFYSYNKTLFVDFSGINYKNTTIRILNLVGQEVKIVDVDKTKMEIGLSDLSKGVYLLNISNEEGMVTRKIRVE